jgi:2'-5' RNA ligase
MGALLGVMLSKTVLPQIAALRTMLSSLCPAQWLTDSELAVRLQNLGEIDPALQHHVSFAIDKAAAAHQGFEIQLAGLSFSGRWGKVRQAWIATAQNAGMLQALTLSTLHKLPAQLQPKVEAPWRPKLLLARFGRSPSAKAQLELQAALAGKSWTMSVRELALLADGGSGLTVQHSAKLPG